MRTRMAFPILLLILLLATCLCAAQEKSEDKEKEKGKDQPAPPKSVWQQAIPVYTFTQRKVNLFDFGSLSAHLKEGPDGSSVISLRIPRLKSIIDRIKFSFFIRPTIYGSPGLDGFALPRMSLNMNPVTGWYYWDF